LTASRVDDAQFAVPTGAEITINHFSSYNTARGTRTNRPLKHPQVQPGILKKNVTAQVSIGRGH